MKVTNNSDIPLALGVWLLHDEYDYIDDPKYISATKLMKPLKATILAVRVPKEQQVVDLEDFISRALGHSLHDSIEKAWKQSYKLSLRKMGYPQEVINRVLINPTPEELAAVKDPIPVYLEQRAKRQFRGYTIGGKFDMVAEGIVHDNKSTTAWTWVYGDKDDDYCTQGSIYKWLNPDIITEDFIRINFIFTDWQKMMAKTNPNYPQKRLAYKNVPLWDNRQTEQWISNRIDILETKWDAPQSELPRCTDDELWRSAPAFKYYADPAKTEGRSTKNFDTKEAADHFWKVEKGGKGIVKIIPGEVKRCAYCEAAPVCEQRLEYTND